MRRDQWWTWSANRPAELLHLEGGFRVTPLLFSTAIDRATLLLPGPDISFGSRAIGGGSAEFTTRHGGTVLEWRYDFMPPGGVTINWRATELAEWGLRYWVVLCIEAPQGVTLHHDPATGVVQGQHGDQPLTITSNHPPALVTSHENAEDVAHEYDDRGYFFLGSRAKEGQVLALRFNLEQAPEQRITLSMGEAKEESASIDGIGKSPEELQSALQAVQDVMAWNHVHDAVNDRPYTVLSRFWNVRKFGGFGVWLSDILYNAMLWSYFDAVAARENLEAVFAWQTEAGNFPCLVTGNDAWVDRSQIPTAAFTVWNIFRHTGDRTFLEWAYPAIRRNHEWWRRCRALGDSGFITYGTSPGVGSGLYAGTKFGAQNESSMDNSPIHEAAGFDAETGLLQTIDVGLNSLYALDAEMLGLIASALGRDEDAANHHRDHRELAALISTRLWDSERCVFANRLPDDMADGGTFIRPIIPTSFYPLVAGAATPEQACLLCDGYLTAPDKFGGHFGLPSTTRDDPAFLENVYWRGRIWPPMNYWTYHGLRRMGMVEEATNLAEKSWALFKESWRDRLCGENYNADTGEIHDQSDTDGFYSWGALLPAIAVAEAADVTPWRGLSLNPSRVVSGFGPIMIDGGLLRIKTDADGWRIYIDGREVLEGNVTGYLSEIKFGERGFSVIIPPGPDRERLGFPGRRIVQAILGETSLETSISQIVIPARPGELRLTVKLGELPGNSNGRN